MNYINFNLICLFIITKYDRLVMFKKNKFFILKSYNIDTFNLREEKNKKDMGRKQRVGEYLLTFNENELSSILCQKKGLFHCGPYKW